MVGGPIAAADLDDAIRLRNDLRTIQRMREAMLGGAIPAITFQGIPLGAISLNVPIDEAADLFRRIFDAMQAAATKRLRELGVEPE